MLDLQRSHFNPGHFQEKIRQTLAIADPEKAVIDEATRFLVLAAYGVLPDWRQLSEDFRFTLE